MANYVSYADMQVLMTAIGNKFSALNGAYVIKGNSAFANLPATPTAAQTGFVYNVTDSFTTDSRFVEGAGKQYPADTNVVIVNLGDATTPNMKYDVIGAFVDTEAINTALGNLQVSLADAFDATESYDQGDIVTYGHKLYQFTADHAAGDWTGSDVTAITVEELFDAAGGDVSALVTRVGLIEDSIAPTFAATESYAAGDLVFHNDVLYRFTAAHTAGAWTGSDATAVTIDALINDIEESIDDVDARADLLAADLADEFDATAAYEIGDVVKYEDVLYKFNTAHAAGAWTGSDVDAVTVVDLVDAADTAIDNVDNRVDSVVADLAPAFVAANAYSEGDIVTYEDGLYKFKTGGHTAGDPWSTSEVDAITAKDLEPDGLTTAQQNALIELLG